EVPPVLREHLVGSPHRSDRRLEMSAAGVLEALAGLEQRLLPDHAQTRDLDDLALRIGDDPMTADDVRGNIARGIARSRLGGRVVPDFAKAGASIISFRPEASDHIDRTIGLIHDCGCKAGLVFNPATPLVWLDHVLEKLDLVLIMSVNPGFGGQSFITEALSKLKLARARIDAVHARTGREIRLEVDGGVKVDNIAAIAKAGADTFVAGSAIFGKPDYTATIAAMRAAVAAA